MLGRKNYTQEEIDSAESAVGRQLAAHRTLAAAAGDDDARRALEEFDSLFFNNLLLALDRHFVHRLRAVAGKDANPLTEVELLCGSLMENGGVLRKSTVIAYVAEKSETAIAVGDRISLTEESFQRLTAAFFAELRRKFL